MCSCLNAICKKISESYWQGCDVSKSVVICCWEECVVEDMNVFFWLLAVLFAGCMFKAGICAVVDRNECRFLQCAS